MISRALPLLWYAAGSFCFLVGSITSILRLR